MFLGILKVSRVARIFQQVVKIKGKDRNSQPNREQHKDIPLKKKKRRFTELEGWALENLTFSKQISGPPDPRGVFPLWTLQGQRPCLGRQVELMEMISASVHKQTQAPLSSRLSCCPDWPSALWPQPPTKHRADSSSIISQYPTPLWFSNPLTLSPPPTTSPHLHKKNVKHEPKEMEKEIIARAQRGNVHEVGHRGRVSE